MQIAGQAAQYAGAKANAKAQARYAASEFERAERYRLDAMEYGLAQFKDDLDYFEELLNTRRYDFQRLQEFTEREDAAIRKDFFRQVASLATRQMEEALAALLDVEGYARSRRQAVSSARAAASDRGVSGQSVEAVVTDIVRQAGEAATIRRLQLSAVDRQLQLEMESARAAAEGDLRSLPAANIAPLALPRAPAPIAPTPMPGPIPQPSLGALLLNIGTTAAGGYMNHLEAGGKNFLKIDYTPTYMRWRRVA